MVSNICRFWCSIYKIFEGITALTLEFVYVINAGTIYEGIPFSDFSIFILLYFFLAFFFYKIGVYDLDLA
jgi:hypothetical protein